MFRSGFMGFLASVSWLITALACISIGLAALGIFDFFAINFFMMNPTFKMYTLVVIGISGAWSLLGFVKHVFYCSGECGMCC